MERCTPGLNLELENTVYRNDLDKNCASDLNSKAGKNTDDQFSSQIAFPLYCNLPCIYVTGYLQTPSV